MENKEIAEVIEQEAIITFDIPAYKDRNTDKPFHKEVKVPTKKAYAIYKRTTEKFVPDKEVNASE